MSILSRMAVILICLALVACDDENQKADPAEINPNAEKKLTGPMTGVYKYLDKDGVINYVDSLDKVPPRYRKKAVHPTGGAVSIVPSTNIDDLLEKHGLDSRSFRPRGEKSRVTRRHGKVVIYTTSWCPACKHAKAYFRRKGVSFVEKDVERSKSNMQQMLRKSGGARGVPVIDVRGKILRGFNSRALDQALSG